MLREALIAASESDTFERIAREVPMARDVAMRFVAGDTLEDAIHVAAELNGAGMRVSLDELGEAVSEERVARDAAHACREILQTMEAEGISGSISVKLTHLGLDADPDLTRGLVAGICEDAARLGRDVTIDMEGSAYTAATIDLVHDLLLAGYDNVGCAVQSYLRRTEEDVERLVDVGASLRLCKGAYAEPAEIAYQSRDEIDANYVRLADRLLLSGTYPRIATHDHRIIHKVKNLARRYELAAHDFEFQMLLGVRPDLQEALVNDGWRLRVYVPFGRQWYPYFVRRIAERPANVVFFLRAVLSSRSRPSS